MTTHDQHSSLPRRDKGCSEFQNLTRRQLLSRSRDYTAALAAVGGGGWIPQIGLRREYESRDVLVHVFLRGGMDGLTTCVPYGDAELYARRPTLAIQPPGAIDGALDLDGFFGLAPAAAPLLTPFSDGNLAIVHAAGSTDPTRSHFDAFRFMEFGIPNQPQAQVFSGWLARHLQGTPPHEGAVLRALSTEDILQQTLAQAPQTLAIPDLANFAFPGDPATAPDRRAAIEVAYTGEPPPMGTAALDTLATIDLLETIDFAGYVPAGGALYPDTEFGQKLKSSAALIKADVGVEVVMADLGHWDLHNQLGPINGDMAANLDDLTRSLEAFYLDLQLHLGRITIVVMSEFGRRAGENGSAGVDHGHGNCMLVMGGHVNGGQVIADWPGLAPADLDNGDLAITIDYRDVVTEILDKRLGGVDVATVFPNYTPVDRGVLV